MPSGMIDWQGWDGELVEEVYACLVLQDHPLGWRRRTDQGDGGVDVLVPDGDGWHVHQVKSSRTCDKQRVQESIEVLLSSGRLPGPLTRWTLAAPCNPNRIDEEWFDQVTAQLDVPCNWAGSTHWNGLRARHPEIVDTLLNGGGDRHIDRVNSVMDLAQVTLTASPQPSDLAGPLAEVCAAASREDPYFRYGFHVAPDAPTREEMLRREGLVVAGTIYGAVDVTIEVYEKFLGAGDGADIGASFVLGQLALDNAGTSYEEVQRDMGFGREMELIGIESIEVRAPGGLAATGETGSVWIGSSVPSNVNEVHHHLTIEDPNGNELSRLEFRSTALTTGFLGQELTSISLDGTLTFTATIPSEASGTPPALSFEPAIDDPVVARVRKLVEFFRHAAPPNVIVWRLEGGALLGKEPLAAPLKVLDDLTIELVDLLGELQPHSLVPLRLPSELAEPALREVRAGAKLSRGEVVTSRFERIPLAAESPAELEELLAVVDSAEMTSPFAVNAFGTMVAVPGVTATFAGITSVEQTGESTLAFIADPPGTVTFVRHPSDERTDTPRTAQQPHPG